LITTIAGARAAVAAIRALRENDDGAAATPLEVKPLQAYFPSDWASRGLKPAAQEGLG
jgi:hypothetical protein